MNFPNLKNCLDNLVKVEKTPGVDCIVKKGHQTIFRYFTGYRDIENAIKTNGNELYVIYSMTKMITVTCALQLMEKGAFKLDDRIDKWLPEYSKMKISNATVDQESAKKITTGASATENTLQNSQGYAKNPITVEHLFTMSAGLDYATLDEHIVNAKNSGKRTTRELVCAMANKTLGFEPGTRFRYSLCHDVLGALIEIWSGKSFGEYLQENFCKPLGLKNTFFGIPAEKTLLDNMAVRYLKNEKGEIERLPLECAYNLTEQYQSGGAGIISTTEDYSVFLDALACKGICANGNRLLKEESVELMKTNRMKGEQVNDFYALRKGYGYGLGVRTHLYPEESGHLSPVGEFGWDGAAGAFSLVDNTNEISLTYFQQMHGWDLAIQGKLINALYKDLKND